MGGGVSWDNRELMEVGWDGGGGEGRGCGGGCC